MSAISSVGSNPVPVFPFHHITRVQMDSLGQRPTMAEGGVLPQVDLHFRSEPIKPIMSKDQMQEVLNKWLKAPEILRSKTGNIIDIVH